MVFIMTKIASLFIFFTLLSGFTLKNKKEEEPEYPKYVKEIAETFAQEIEKEFGLECMGNGGSMPYDVEKIEVIFCAHRRASLEEAREIEVKAVERLLQMINSHEKIRPYLREFPFNPSRVGILITFDNEYNQHYSDGTITFMTLGRGKIHYRCHDPIANDLINIVAEPYEEAKAIVQAKPLNRDLRYHKAHPYEAHMDQLFKTFAKEVKKRWGLTWWAEGGKMADGIEEIAVSLITLDRAPIEKARKLEIEITERLLEIINADTFLRPYLKESPFNPSRTKVAITFKKYDGEYYTDGSIANVRQADNKLYYSIMPPPKDNIVKAAPIPLSEEPYEEAKKVALEQNAKM